MDTAYFFVKIYMAFTFFKKLRDDPGPSFSAADVFLFAQIPNPFVATFAASIAAYVFARSTASGRTKDLLEKIERPLTKAFRTIHPHLPLLNKIHPSEFDTDRAGASTLTVGIAQIPIFLGSLAIALLDPLQPLGWMAAAATGFFAGSNVKAGLQLNDPSRVKADKKWLEVATSTQVLNAAGLCTSGLMAGLVTSFGFYALAPIGIALGSAALVAAGKIGMVRLNTGIPMGALSSAAILNTAVGIINGNWLAALSNGCSINGEVLLTKFYHQEYKTAHNQDNSPQRNRRLRGRIYYRETPEPPKSPEPERPVHVLGATQKLAVAADPYAIPERPNLVSKTKEKDGPDL